MDLSSRLRQLWRILRTVTGDDAYERYLAHRHHEHRVDRGDPLTREEFFKAEQERKWNGIRRCC